MSFVHGLGSLLQLMPDIRGKRRVCRLLISALGVEKSKDILINTRSGTFRLPNLKEAISFELYINGIYEKGLVDLLEKQIPPSGIFLDIGANIGSISISLAKRRKDIRIIAVEASPWIFAVLKENVERNGIANITLLNKAVYSISGKTMPMYAPREYFGKGSLKPVYTHESEEVETITVADILTVYGQGKADYIKVDVEGFEKSVFEGLGAYTEVEVKPRIIFEYAASTEESAGFKAGDAQQVLISKGFQLQGLDHMFRPVGEKSANLVLDGSANIMAC